MAILKSGEQELIWADVKRWAQNALIFSGPAILVGLVALQENEPVVAFAIFAKELYSLGIDLYRKWLTETKYKV